MGYQLDFGVVLSGHYLGLFLTGIATTLFLFAVCWAVALCLGVALALLRAMPFRLLQGFVWLYVEYHRNVPLLVQLLFWNFGIPQLLPEPVNKYINAHNPELTLAIIAIGLFGAAYMSEDFRSAFRAIPDTQREAARSQGFGFVGSMRWIILPQAWRLSLPPLVNQTLNLLKATSLAAAIGVAELSYAAREIENQSYRVFEAFSIVTLAYLLGTFSIMLGGAALSQRFRLLTR
jgi:polar amino acid transport system permease protein